jgi:hypothetical protein
MEVQPVRSLVFGFLTVSDAVVNARLVCKAWSTTLAAWTTITSPGAMRCALRASIQSLNLKKTQLDLQDVLDLFVCGLPRLERLWLPKLDMTEFLKRVPEDCKLRLKVLGFAHGGCTRGLKLLKDFPSLRYLELPGLEFLRPRSVAPLGSLTRLSHLRLSGALFVNHPRFPLLPRLRELDLSFSGYFGSQRHSFFADVCQLSALVVLNLAGATWLGGLDWDQLRKLRKLEKLNLSRTRLQREVFQVLRHLTLRALDLEGVPDTWLSELRRHPSLELLKAFLREGDVECLLSMPYLQKVYCRDTDLDLDLQPLRDRGIAIYIM